MTWLCWPLQMQPYIARYQIPLGDGKNSYTGKNDCQQARMGHKLFRRETGGRISEPVSVNTVKRQKCPCLAGLRHLVENLWLPTLFAFTTRGPVLPCLHTKAFALNWCCTYTLPHWNWKHESYMAWSATVYTNVMCIMCKIICMSCRMYSSTLANRIMGPCPGTIY